MSVFGSLLARASRGRRRFSRPGARRGAAAL